MDELVYHSCGIAEFQGNPLIEALPPLMDTREVAGKLIEHPDYFPSERESPQRERMLLTQRVTQFYQPGTKDVELFEMVDRSLRWGYAWRNPLSSSYRLRFGSGVPLHSEGSYYMPYIPTTGGFALLGISGLGKTSALRKILSLFPQVISHRNYKGTHFQETQVVWIHLDCPKDGSLKGLSESFFTHIDHICGTTFAEQYCTSRSTLDSRLNGMVNVAASVHVGIIILDEIQNLCTSKSIENIPLKTLNFIVTMINTINVPVVMVGTPRALSFFQRELQQAKRASSQGAALWERMEEGSEWKLFVRAMWGYQYTAKEIPLTDEIMHELYLESVGVPFLATQIYKLAQEKAMTTGTETFNEKDFHVIARKKLGLTKPMVEALKSGREINLKAFLDLTPFTREECQRIFPSSPILPDPEPPKPVDKQTVQQTALSTLLGMGLSERDAKRYVDWALAKHRECPSSVLIAREAYGEYLKSTEAMPANPRESSSDVVVGYEENLANGTIGL